MGTHPLTTPSRTSSGDLAPEAFRKAFTDWITAVFELASQHICIDGKTMRGVKKLDPDGLFKPFYKKEIVRTISEECGHGRVEKRVMESIIDPMRFSVMEHYISMNKWQNLRSVHKMTRVRYDKRTGKEGPEVTYFISSHTDPEKVFKMIREHWSVENNLHYCLDVIFREDQSLKRRGNAAKT